VPPARVIHARLALSEQPPITRLNRFHVLRIAR
jgi:hypothetical protein